MGLAHYTNIGARVRARPSQLGGGHRVRAGVRRIAGVRVADPAVLGACWSASARSSAPPTPSTSGPSCRRRPSAPRSATGCPTGWATTITSRSSACGRCSDHPKLIEQGHKFFTRWGAWAIVLGRFSGPLRASVPIVAGIAQMPRLRFQIANWSSAFLWAFVLLSPGTLRREVVARAVLLDGEPASLREAYARSCRGMRPIAAGALQ